MGQGRGVCRSRKGSLHLAGAQPPGVSATRLGPRSIPRKEDELPGSS